MKIRALAASLVGPPCAGAARLPAITPDYPWLPLAESSDYLQFGPGGAVGTWRDPLCRQRLWRMAVPQKMVVYDTGVGCTCLSWTFCLQSWVLSG